MERQELVARVRDGYPPLARWLDTADLAALERPRRDDGWTGIEVVAHLAAWYEVVAGRLRLLLQGRGNEISWVEDREVDAWNARFRERDRGQTLAQARERLERAHAEVVAALEALPPSAWGDSGVPVPFGEWIPCSTYEHIDEHLPDIATPLAPREVAALLRALARGLEAEIQALPERVLSRHTEGEWCPKEVLGHLIEAEHRGFAGRIRDILEGPAPSLENWDPEAVARARRDCARPAAELLAEFLALREEGARLVERLQPADLERGKPHPLVGFLRVGDLLHEWLHHDRNHARQLFAAVQAFVWPAMGDARRFSDS